MIAAKVFWNPMSPDWTVHLYFRVAGLEQLVLLVVTFLTLPPHSSICFEMFSSAIHSHFPHGISSVTITSIGFDASSAANARFIALTEQIESMSMMMNFFIILELEVDKIREETIGSEKDEGCDEGIEDDGFSLLGTFLIPS